MSSRSAITSLRGLIGSRRSRRTQRARLRILMVTSEAYPFAKTGGLADSVSAMALALAERGHELLVLIPRYYFTERTLYSRRALRARIPSGLGELAARFYRGKLKGQSGRPVSVRLLRCGGYFDHRHLYGSVYEPLGRENGARFGLLCMSALPLCRALGWYPDIIHCHDWPTALLPYLLQRARHSERRFAHCRSLLTIHNIGYQGHFPPATLSIMGFDHQQLLDSGLYVGDGLNFLHSGILNADLVTTVSPHNAAEIVTPQLGFGLHKELADRPLLGILNGIDYSLWDPARDPYLSEHYDADTLEQRAVLKIALLREAGLAERPDQPLIGMVTRLASQKGIQELCEVLPRILTELDAQCIILGTGEQHFKERLGQCAQSYSGFTFWNQFDEGRAHRIEAGSDFFLMPSRYEPCGLNQMYSLRYGAVPIVGATGGLVDTIRPYRRAATDADDGADEADGFFIEHIDPQGIFDAVAEALTLWRTEPARYRALQRAGMRRRFTWQQAANHYEAAYRQALLQ